MILLDIIVIFLIEVVFLLGYFSTFSYWFYFCYNLEFQFLVLLSPYSCEFHWHIGMDSYFKNSVEMYEGQRLGYVA